MTKSSISQTLYALAVSTLLVTSGCNSQTGTTEEGVVDETEESLESAGNEVTDAFDNDEANASEVRFENIEITGAQQAPEPVTTEASGTFEGTYDNETNVLTYTITFTDITPTAMHFHKGAPGEAGGVEVPITDTNSPVNGSTPALTDEQEADLLAGNWYVNIHSEEHPAGEIRGQLTQ